MATWLCMDFGSSEFNASTLFNKENYANHEYRYAYVGTDAAIHIAEEMDSPGRRIPQIMNLTMLIGLLSALPFFTVLMYTADDPELVASSPLPSIELFHQATGSRAAAVFMQTAVTMVYVCQLPCQFFLLITDPQLVSVTSQWVTSGRMAWAFARDVGISN